RRPRVAWVTHRPAPQPRPVGLGGASIVGCLYEGLAARGAAPLARSLRRRLRLRGSWAGRPRLRRPPGTALPPLARARSLTAVDLLDRRLESRLVGRLSRAPVLPTGIRDPGRSDPDRPPLAPLDRDGVPAPLRDRLPRPGHHDLRSPCTRARRPVA